MMETWMCLLCGQRKCATWVYRVRDSDHHQVVRCLSCEHVQLTPVPSDDELAEYYVRGTQRRVALPGMDREQKRRHVSVDTARRVLLGYRYIIGNTRNAKVLDVGAGDGFFGEDMRQRGFDVDEVDYVPYMAQLPPKKRYGLVTAFHVLEHVRNPIATLKEWWSYVERHGHMLVEIPNRSDSMIRECAPYHWWYWQRAHLHYFDVQHFLMCAAMARIDDAALEIQSVQRYSLWNREHWFRTGQPDRDSPIGCIPKESTKTERDNDLRYRVRREESFQADTLLLVLRKV